MPARRLPSVSATGSRRRLVLHEDDVGMCHGANSAFLELSRLGACSSGAVMVPCPWFLEIAEAAAHDPRLDLGVHLTLNAEKQHYKWRPLTTPSRAAGLTDEFGFFWPDVATTRRKAVPQAVETELRAQIDAAYRAGIDVTHLDAHMGAALSPEFCDIYIRLGLEYRLPVLLTKTLSAYSPNDNLVGVTEEAFQGGVSKARKAGFAIFDAAIQTTWGRPRSRSIEPAYKALVDGVRDGLTFFCLHSNAPGELELIEPRSAYVRTEEYELFRDKSFRDWLAAQDLDISGMRPLRDDLRAALSTSHGGTAADHQSASATARKAATRSTT
ncbi:ChbG/HpnK family deacetylase [Mesorhizobium sp. M00.F.Ca.ET.186.01.1.1]|nr:ChbG/HpnK family deacetylase [bacterium M00.F.Ca.ET.205.01.1.1]TGU52706.1 ChbG/HpnK family deacetylase [bacterium M00.F.Ca.ET.152.01.1.1]TGV36146.1 ChbG/HpnK family deacetylase [Mesorhizobium sp. M00.F.Ca.ET.186.01.1.1]TGZ43258.1 ChbG/HpnK family deacetylase [bacterium M00.F.Ca.ET.162.01.1.1]